ncbi:MAG: sigma factor-like helix-turn-helix DNA-binding protein [Bacilli bacterium]|nr:sigma factor-like helix-turn-helix DNA-binding protein [Bacilli bacterium]
MDKNTRTIILYDYYKNLLNEKEQKYFEDYYFNNLTLMEISEKMGGSRNNIHQTLKRICNKLDDYEIKLMLYNKSSKLEKIIEKVTDKKIVKQIKDLGI